MLLSLFFGIDEAKLNFSLPVLFCGSLKSQHGNIFSSFFDASLAPYCNKWGPGVFPPVSAFGIQ